MIQILILILTKKIKLQFLYYDTIKEIIIRKIRII